MKQYLDFVSTVAQNGQHKPNRTGVDTISSFSHSYKIDLQDGFPLLTTKQMSDYRWNSMMHELFWYLSGEAHIRNLRDKTKIWDAWADDSGGLETAYGRFWRHYPLSPEDQKQPQNGEVWADDDDISSQFINEDGTFDQIAYIIDTLKNNPNSRRMVLTAWHPGNAAVSLLPPCHFTCVFNVQGNTLNTHLTQRSGDIALGIPFNIACYSVLTHLIAQEVGLEVGEFSHQIVDSHIYCGDGDRGEWYASNLSRVQSIMDDDGPLAAKEYIETNAPAEQTENADHMPGLLEQLSREPHERPTLTIADKPLSELTADDVELNDYTSESSLTFGVAE